VGVSRRPFTLLIVLGVGLLSVALNIVTNYLTSAETTSQLSALIRQWSLPALGALVLLLLAGQGALFLADRPVKRRWNAERPPYPGLEAFTSADAGVFFGRDDEIQELLDRLHPSSSRDERFVAVVGPSGSGKSSLVHAGLIPQLTGRRHRWVVLSVVLENSPVENLARCLASADPALDSDQVADRMAADRQELGRQVAALQSGRSSSVLLVIDQAEELFTIADDTERNAFLELLRAALHDSRRFFVIATLRSDFLDEFMAVGFTSMIRRPVVVGPLDRPTLFRVIEEPAAQAGMQFAPHLVSTIVDDAGGGDALPLLAYTLESLYRITRSTSTVTESDYRRIGGVAGALSKQADRVVEGLHDVGREAVLSTLLRFVTLDESGPARRRVPRRALSDAERRVVDAFVDARLLVSSMVDGDATVEVAHDALFRQWPPLRQAVEARADELRGRAELERWAQDWERAGRSDAYLLGGERLETAQRWEAELGASLDEVPMVGEFLEHSRRLDRAAMTRLSDAVAHEALAEIERDPELGILLGLAALEDCAPTPLANRALVSTMANPVVRVLRGHRSVVRAVAWSPDGALIATASQDRDLRIWDAEHGTEQFVLGGHEESIWALAWSPDGHHIASASDDHTARVWDARTGELVAMLVHSDWVRGVAWSPDGTRMATGSHDRSIRIWSLDAPSTASLVIDAGVVLWDVAWSPDGELIATTSPDGVVRLWDAVGGQQVRAIQGLGEGEWLRRPAWSPVARRLAVASTDRTVQVWEPDTDEAPLVLNGHLAAVWDVAWSADGERIASASRDRTVRLWGARSGAELTVLSGHTDAVQSVAWSPDGDLLASGSRDRTARVWQAERPDGGMLLRGHADAIQALAWSPDGSRLATASGDHTARVWDPTSAQPLCVLRGHEDALRGLAWSPDGSRLVTASDDRSARVWDTHDGRQVLVLATRNWVRGVAWSPDGSRIVTALRDRLVEVWDAGTGASVRVLSGHDDEVDAVAWSPNGRWIASASGDRTARIWDARRGTELHVLSGHEEWVWAVAWSPDGQRVLTASDDCTARVWNPRTGDEVLVLRGHQDWIRGIAWSPDGRYVVTGSHDGTARVWDSASGTELAIVFVAEGWVSALGWSPDGARLAIGAYDRAVVQDAVTSLDAIKERARRRVSRHLTTEERRRVGLPLRTAGPTPT
jgi:WD40 repeat protein/energy-coupling factor transporter ATP-binding protein EcfA2